MAEYLPRSWANKRVAVVIEGEGGGSFEANLVSDNAGGVIIEIVEDERTRILFIPWAAIRYVELLEEAGEGARGVRVTRKPPGL